MSRYPKHGGLSCVLVGISLYTKFEMLSLSHFCTLHPCDQHRDTETDRQTDTQTTLRATSVAISRILCTACMRCGLKIFD